MSQHHDVTAGIDIGDRYSHLCLLDTESGEVIEEGRIPTNTKAFERRFSDAEPMRIAIETGTHSPWISRMLEKCGHEILVANARKVRLIYGEGHKNDMYSKPSSLTARAVLSWRCEGGREEHES